MKLLGSLLLLLILLPAGVGAATDGDGDGIEDAKDVCPYFANASDQKDSDGDGIGDACECGDANGDGRVDVSDVVAAEQMIRGDAAASPLCDANDYGADDRLRCEASDIEAINAAIFGSCFPVCRRYPTPPAGKTACKAPGP